MTTRILYWNIQKFGNDRLFATSATNAAAALDRLGVVQGIIANADPDILVVVEVTSGIGGGTGATSLLDTLRGNTTDPDRAEWRMVPLQIVGSKKNVERVAIYYRGAKGTVTRYFTGPYVWTGGANGKSADPASVSATQYTNNTDTALLVPPGTIARTIPNSAAVQYRPNQPELQSAAQIEFTMNPVGSKTSPGKKLKTLPSYGTWRQPVMVSFFETDSSTGPATTRNITLFAIHAPPAYYDAYDFMTRLLASTDELVAAPSTAKNEIKVICGDFNLNTLADDGSRSVNYDVLTTINKVTAYKSLNSPPATTVVNANDLEAYQGYFATHINLTPNNKKKSNLKIEAKLRFLWSDNTVPTNVIASPYPGYRYISSVKSTPNTYAVDNFLVWRASTAAGTTGNFTIMNPLVGTPFNAVLFPPSGAPKGIITTGIQFANAPTNWMPAGVWPQAPNADDFVKLDAAKLVAWNNYGKIRDTSDHLPLFATV